MVRLEVKKRFLDKFNTSRAYEVGQVIEFPDYTSVEKERIASIVSQGLADVVVESPKGGEKLPVVFGAIDLSAKVGEVAEAIAGEAEIENLKSALDAEGKEKKPRKMVLDALNARIAEVEAELSEKEELVELADGKVISIAKGIAYGEDNGEKVPLEAGEYRSETHIYTVGDGGEVAVTEIPE